MHARPLPPDRARRQQLRDVLRAQRTMAAPSVAERAARQLARWVQPAGTPTRPPSLAERELLDMQRTRLTMAAAPSQQWAGLGSLERRMLIAYSGLRESRPGEPLASIAAREWPEFTPSERAAIGQAVRLLIRRLARLSGVMNRWWVG